MPTKVPIEVFMVGRTMVDKDEVDRWMKHIGANEFVIPEDEEISNPALLIALAGKRCYMSFEVGLNPNVTKIRKEYVDYFDNVLNSGHGSVLEHSVYNFAIEGVSRVFTAEMNRHRAGWAISEGSLRFIRFSENIPYWEPDSIKGEDVIPAWEDSDSLLKFIHRMHYSEATVENYTPAERLVNFRNWMQELNLDAEQRLAFKKQVSRYIFNRAFENQEWNYSFLETIWADELAPESKFAGKKQITSMMRRIIGLGVATGGVWSGNMRALRHVFTMRAAPAAEEEMLHVFGRVVEKMVQKEPLLFGDFYVDDAGFWRPKYVKV